MKKKSASQSAFFNLRLLTGLFLALGGVFQFGNPGVAFSENYTVEGRACEWSAGPDMPSVGVRSVGVYFPPNGKFYAMGGRSSDSAGSDFTHPFEYDPVSNTWTTKSATYQDNQVNNMACGVLTVINTGSFIYCVGGSAAGQTTATARVFYYDPVTDSLVYLTAGDNWPGDSSGTILPGGFATYLPFLQPSNRLYILGGFDINIASTNQIWEFNPLGAVGAKWTQKVNTPMGVMYAPTCTIYGPDGGFIYLAGASDYVGGTVIDTTNSFKFDPMANTTSSIAAIPRATGETRALSFKGRMYVMGGGRVAPAPSNEVDIYDPGTDTWSIGIPFVTGRRNFPTDTDGERHIWLAGGYASDGVTPLASMEIFECSVVGELTLVSAASRKHHGNAGTFDIDLPLTGTPGVECRVGNGGTFRQAIVFSFSEAVTSVSGTTTTTCGSVNSTTINGSTVTVELGHVNCDGSDITVTVPGVSGPSGSVDASATMALRTGDVNADGVVNNTDLNEIRMNVGRGLVTEDNFRDDITVDGKVNHGDTTLEKSKL